MSRKPPVTATNQQLPFDKLSAEDFERLCLWLTRREGFEGVEYLGEAGSEQGRDLLARRDGRRVVFQCKRVIQFGPATAKGEIEKLRKLPKDDQPDDIVFVVSRAVSVTSREKIRKVWGDEETCRFWAGAELDERVKRHPDVVREFFHLPPPSEGRRVLWNVPRRNPYFTGREDVLAALHVALAADGSAALGQAIAGLGGVGKTQTAVEYCHRHRDDYEAVVWVRAEKVGETRPGFPGARRDPVGDLRGRRRRARRGPREGARRGRLGGRPGAAPALLARRARRRGRYEEAEPLYQRSLAILENAIGPEHPTTVKVRANYERFLKERQK